MNNCLSLYFSVTCQTNLGEQVCVCGNVPQLGMWDIWRSLKLSTNQKWYPEWKNVKPIELTLGIQLEFKVCVRNSKGQLIRWEDIQGNRFLLPTASMLIGLDEGQLKMSFYPLKEHECTNTAPAASVPRKKTIDILHQLSDEMSSSSSGNEKQFWLEIAAEKNKKNNCSLTRTFISESHKILEGWFSKNAKSPANSKPETNPKIRFEHLIFSHVTEKSGQKSPKSQISPKQKVNVIDETSNVFIEEFVSASQLEQTCQKMESNLVYVCHLLVSNQARQVLNNVRNLRDFVVIYLDAEADIAEMLKFGQILSTSNPQHVQQFIELCDRKKIQVFMIKENIFKVHYNNENILFIFDYSLKYSKLKEINDFSQIQKLIATNKHFKIPENYRASVLFEQQIFKQVKKNKFCIVITCDRLSDVPQKTIAHLIGLASRPNVDVYIITEEDEMTEVSKKLPISEMDKMLVLNGSGDILYPFKKPINIYQELQISRKKYLHSYEVFKKKLAYWKQNQEIQFRESKDKLSISFHKNSLGKILADFIEKEIVKFSLMSKIPYFSYRFETEDLILVEIEPIIVCRQFYMNVIVSINQTLNSDPHFFCFNFERSCVDRRKSKASFLEKACLQKNTKFYGFHLQHENSSQGLAQATINRMLEKIILETYNSSLTQMCDSPEKLMVKSDLIH